MFFIRLMTILVMASWFAACSYLGFGEDGMFRDRQGDYLTAPTVPRMEIPPELDTFTIDDLYLIPPEPGGNRETFVRPPPPRPIDSRIREGVVVQQFGERAWIVIGATAGQVWPRLRDFFPTEGIPLAAEDAVGGMLETDWITDPDSSERHRYRVTVEPGLHAGNSEIYVRHVSDGGVSTRVAPTQWPEVSEDRARESVMLASISLYLADRADLYRASSVSLLAGSIQAESKANLIDRPGAATALTLRIDFDRAWSQVLQSLNSANIEIISSDRDERRVSVSFSGEETEDGPGFFARLFRRGPDEDDFRDFHVDLSGEDGAIRVDAEVVSGAPAPRLQDLLIRTINDNLI